MKNHRVVITRFGGPEVLKIIEGEMPEPRHKEVRLKTVAAGVSFADLLIREGIHPLSWLRETPFTPGWDIVGIVERVGKDVDNFRAGEMVAALPVLGGYSEYICLPAASLVPVPEGVDPAEAASLVLNYVTAYQMLHRVAHIHPKERILIHSAAGGVGTALLQLGHFFNLEMYGTASQSKHELVARSGGIPVDYQACDFETQVLDLSGDGVDAVFDGIGGRNLRRSYAILHPGGRLIAYGQTATLQAGRRNSQKIAESIGSRVGASMLNLLPDQRTVRFYSIQNWQRRKPLFFKQDLSALLALLTQHSIHPVIAGRLPIHAVRQAHEQIGSGSATGKVVLVMDQNP